MKRALIAWEFERDGIWCVRSPNCLILEPVAVNDGVTQPAQSQSLRELLSESLWNGLRRWNDRGCTLGSPRRITADHEWESFDREGRALAESTQSELGDDWQVLWAASDGAWHFVRFP